MFSQYGGLWRAVKVYWKDYGGWADLSQSPMFHVSILTAGLVGYGWISMDWRALTIGMMPTILGFSLAAYAITFALMGSKLHLALSDAVDGKGRPLSRSVNATLFHNVFVQSVCLTFAVISKGGLIAVLLVKTIKGPIAEQIIKYEVKVGELFGSFLLIYAVTLLFSSAIAMFRLGRLIPIRRNTPAAANDSEADTNLLPARELYGFRWAIIRTVARLLRVKG